MKNQKISDDNIIEQYIDGDEYTVAILDNLALPSIKLKPPGKFYDYEAKYNSSETKYICPSGLDKDQEDEIKKISVNCFNILKCKRMG